MTNVISKQTWNQCRKNECAPINLHTKTGATTYQHVSQKQSDDDTYRFPEGNETAWTSSWQAGHGTGTRPSPSSKNNKRWWAHFDEEGKCPQERTLTQDYLLRLFGQSLWGMTRLKAIPQQCSPPHQQGQAWTAHWWWWPCAKLDEKPSSLKFLLLSGGSQ